MAELCPWWLKLLLRPSAAAVLVAHVQVPHSRLISAERLSADELAERAGGGARKLAGAGLGFLQGLLLELVKHQPGRYLLTHVAGEPQCGLFRTLPPDVEVQVGGRGVLCSMPFA